MLKCRKITENSKINEAQQDINNQIDALVDSWSSMLKKELITGTTEVDRNLWDKFKDFIASVTITPQGEIQVKSPRRLTFGKTLSPDFSQYWTGSHQSKTTPATGKPDFKSLWSGKYENKMSLEDYKSFQEIFSILSEESNVSSIKIFQIIDKHAEELRKKLKELVSSSRSESTPMPQLAYQLSPEEKERVRPKSDKEVSSVKTAIQKAPISQSDKEKVLKIISKYRMSDKGTPVDIDQPTIGQSKSFRGSTTQSQPEKTDSGEVKATTKTEQKPTVSPAPTAKKQEDNLENVPKMIKSFVHILEDQNKMRDKIKESLKDWPNKIDDFYDSVRDILLDEIAGLNPREKKHYKQQIEEIDDPKRFIQFATSILMKLEDD